MLVSMTALMEHALKNKYAVGYFEAWNLEAVLSVINAAERTQSPIIIGFSGNFLSNPERKVKENIWHYGALAKAIAEKSSVPCAVLLNESPDLGMLVAGLAAGFNAVMFQDNSLPFDKQVGITAYLAKTAHWCGASVESELGHLPDSDISTGTLSEGTKTDPDQAEWFVRECGIDALAIACGNVHLLEGSKKAELDFDLIRAIHNRVDVPLVLHGGTGVSDDSLREAIDCGIAKINVGTVMKRIFINTIREYLSGCDTEHTDPHKIIGMGGSEDMLVQAREAVTEEVVRFLRIFGSCGKARLW